MMGFEVLVDSGVRALEYLKRGREVAEFVKEVITAYDPGAEVYLFGSVVRGDYTAASDIDILVVTRNVAGRVRQGVDLP